MSKPLTAKAVEKHQPNPKRRLEIPDGLLPGLYLIVQPSGAKSWAVRYRANGRPAKVTLGRYPAIELATARELARHELKKVARGRDPAAEKRAEKANGQTVALPQTVNALCDLYVDRRLKPNVRRWWAAAGEIDNHIRPRLGKLALDGLTKGHAREMVRQIGETYPVAANRALARLQAVLNWAVDQDLIDANVAAGIKRPTEEKPVDRVLSDAELRTLWAAADGLAYPAKQFARLMILSGQRRDDVRLMHWNEIDPDGLTWIIPAARYKSGRAHLVPLSDAMVDILKAMPFREADGYVLSLDGGTRAYTNVQRPQAALHRATKVTGWTWHDLRRTCRTGMSRLGIQRDNAERAIGHSVGGKLDRTYDLYEFADEKRVALEAWAQHVQGIVAGNVHRLERAQ